MSAHPEHSLQVMVTKCVRACVPQPHFFTGIDRSAKKGQFQHVREKARGLVSGTPDTVLVTPNRTVWVELKAPGNRPTEQQNLVGEAIIAAGGAWGWASSVVGYIAVLRAYGVPLDQHADIIAAGHDATLASAAIRREEAKTGAVSKKRSYKPQAAKPSAAQIARSVARQRRVAH